VAGDLREVVNSRSRSCSNSTVVTTSLGDPEQWKALHTARPFHFCMIFRIELIRHDFGVYR